MAGNHQELAQNLMQLSEKCKYCFKLKFSSLISHALAPFKVAVPIEFMNDYSKDSSIHGVKYFSESQRHWLEK